MVELVDTLALGASGLGRVGSSPTLGTTDTSGWRNWQTRQVEILSVVGSSPIPGTAVSTFIDFLKNGQFL